MKMGTGKTALLSLILISLEAVSILVGTIRVVGSEYVKWKTERDNNKKVEEGRFVRVENDHYTHVIVPDLKGRDFNKAAKEFDELGGWLRKGGYDYSDKYPEDTIIAQDIKPGTEIISGSVLYVTLSLGPKISHNSSKDSKEKDNQGIVVPDLTGMTLGEAGSLLEKKGLDMGLPTYSNTNSYPKDVVIGQSVKAGSRVPQGEIIFVELNRGASSQTNQSSSYKENNNFVDDTKLCKLASDYYYNHKGVRPPVVRIDSYDGDIVVIHLYEALTDHDATWDWYHVNRNTGETTNIMGESFNIFTD